jgi:SAM-dependent methyltransferase
MRAFNQLEQREPYFRGRWVYLRHVAKWVRELAPASVLEVGPGPHRFVPGSDTLDLDGSASPTFLQDAGAAPWPIADGTYALVLGLQCWEHFRGKQLVAFREAQRVAGSGGHVLLSIPYRWEDTNKTHRGIDDERIRDWTGGVAPERRLRVRKPEGRERLLLLYRGAADS